LTEEFWPTSCYPQGFIEDDAEAELWFAAGLQACENDRAGPSAGCGPSGRLHAGWEVVGVVPPGLVVVGRSRRLGGPGESHNIPVGRSGVSGLAVAVDSLYVCSLLDVGDVVSCFFCIYVVFVFVSGQDRTPAKF